MIVRSYYNHYYNIVAIIGVMHIQEECLMDVKELIWIQKRAKFFKLELRLCVLRLQIGFGMSCIFPVCAVEVKTSSNN